MNEYMMAREIYVTDITKVRKEEEKDFLKEPTGIIPHKISDFYVTPCLKIIIEKGVKGVNLEHNERLVFLQITKFFLDDKAIHDFFRYQPDYDYSITQRMIEHNRKREYSPTNCDRIIYWGYCPCGGPKGCCGTFIYRAYRFPDEVYDKIKKYYE
jgi:DNA primase large subunit